MEFCPKCDFMFYLKTKQDEGLFNYCKNCNWEEQCDFKTKKVYESNYKNNYLIENVTTNKYTCMDTSLPRLTNIKCINENCPTNIDFTRGIMIYSSNDISSLIPDTISYNLIKVNDEQQLIITDNIDTIMELLTDVDKEVYFKKDNEVIFIKYDGINMKYIYICCHCNKSWKNK